MWAHRRDVTARKCWYHHRQEVIGEGRIQTIRAKDRTGSNKPKENILNLLSRQFLLFLFFLFFCLSDLTSHHFLLEVPEGKPVYLNESRRNVVCAAGSKNISTHRLVNEAEFYHYFMTPPTPPNMVTSRKQDGGNEKRQRWGVRNCLRGNVKSVW